MSAATDSMKLQAFLASCGIGSRRACEEIIREGRVSVNGITASIGDRVGGDERITLDGKVVRPESKLRYIALNKPPGFLSTMSDDRGRDVAASLLEGTVPERVYNVGRLDQWSCGLLLFTNDGAFASRLVHPSGGIEKEYEVHTDKDIPMDLADRFERGLEIEGSRYKAKRVRRVGPRTLRAILVEGKNRELRIVLGFFGLRAMRLQRIRIGEILLGDLGEGEHRELNSAEIASILDGKTHIRSDGTLSEGRHDR